MKQTAFSRSDTVQDVLSRLRQDIILYRYRDNQPIRELELAKYYQCSRGAVRSAFVVLEKEGLIVTHPNGTKTVSCLTIWDIHNLYDLREFIELTAIKQFFENAQYDMTEIFEVANRLRTIIPNKENLEQILEIDTAFHGCVVGLSKNKALIQTWNNISQVMRVVFLLNMTRSEEYLQDFLNTFRDSHASLVSCLLTDAQNCISQYKSHIATAREVSIAAVGNMLEDKIHEKCFN